MTLWRPDPTFYPSARMAMEAPRETLGYVATLNANGDGRPDALAVVDLDPDSSGYGQVVGRLEMPYLDDELHHFGWNACSAALCPYAPHPHVERRYLVVPGLRSSRIYVVDTKPDPRNPQIVKVISPEEVASRAGYSRPHTVHCGPDGIYMSALGNPDGDGPGGVFILDHESFEVRGRWEVDRGPQYLAYDFWWHLGHDVMVTSEWGTPNMIEGGLDPQLLLGKQYGHRLHVWDLRKRTHLRTLDVGDHHQMALELRPAHDPTKTYGFMGVVTSVEDLSASVWLWHREHGDWAIEKVITVPAEPAEADRLPPALQPFGAVPPIVTDLVLSLDDRHLFVSCWGTGQLHAYDVSDPFKPVQTGSVRIGGIVERSAHPGAPERPRSGGPQMVEASRDGRRVYFTNSLYASWDEQFYPDGIESWLVKADVDEDGGIALDPGFFVDFSTDGRRAHQVRLSGGDASSDSYCFP
ncbi:MAG: selenium-binding protein SBP56-related protein [Egibacteraceae bacterium]